MLITLPHSDFFNYYNLIDLNLLETFKYCIRRVDSLTPLVDSNHFEFGIQSQLLQFEFDEGSIIEMVFKFGKDTLVVLNDYDYETLEYEEPIKPLQF